MGYLDNSSVTVDAVLTKQGRKIISEGRALNVSYFTLSDTGIDYTLWNPDHPSGSAFYGEAIENLPQVEALPNSQYAVRNKLVTLGINSIAMPAIQLSTTSHTFDTATALTINVKLLGYSPAPGVTGQAGIHLMVPDTNVVSTSTGTPVDITGNAYSFIYEQDIANAKLYELLGTGAATTGGVNFIINPATNLTSADGNGTKVELTFIDILTGGYASSILTINDNLVPESNTMSGGGMG